MTSQSEPDGFGQDHQEQWADTPQWLGCTGVSRNAQSRPGSDLNPNRNERGWCGSLSLSSRLEVLPHLNGLALVREGACTSGLRIALNGLGFTGGIGTGAKDLTRDHVRCTVQLSLPKTGSQQPQELKQLSAERQRSPACRSRPHDY